MRILAFAFLVLGAPVAYADLAPPPGYVEQCTIDKQCPKEGTTCEVYHGKTNEECAKAATDKGMTEKCRTRGATVATAVFCPAKPTKSSAWWEPRPRE